MLRGSLVALITPMKTDGAVDFTALDGLVAWHLEEGTDGIVALGTTGEASMLSRAEYRRVLDRVVQQVAGSVPVLAGTGSASTRATIKQTQLARRVGADGALVVTPYYVRPTQAGLIEHYRALVSAVDLPVCLYNVPSRTGCDLLPDTVAQLAQSKNIIGLKEAGGSVQRIAELCDLLPGTFAVLSGDDATCAEAMLTGAQGVISVVANVVPEDMTELCSACFANPATGREVAQRMAPLIEAMSLQTNPIPVKWALHRMSRCGEGIRLPLTPLAESLRDRLVAALNQHGISTTAD